MGFLITLIFVALSYLRPQEIFPEWASYRIMLWLGWGGLLVCGLELLKNRLLSFRAPQMYLLLVLMVVMALSVAASGWLGGALLAVEDFGRTIVLFLLIVLSVNTWRRLRILAVTIVMLTVALVIQGSWSYYDEEESNLVIQQRDGPEGAAEVRRIRALGELNDPNDLAQAVLTVLPFLGLAWVRGRRIRSLLWVVLPAAALLFGVYLTRSRGGLVALLALILLASRRRWGWIATALLTATAAVLLLASNFTEGRQMRVDESAYERLDAWGSGLMMLRSAPLLGVGYGMFLEYHTQTAHNSFVLCFAELGLLGYFVWLALLVLTIWELSSLTRLSGDDAFTADLRRWAGTLQLALYTYLAGAFFLSRTYAQILYIVLAMAVALAELARRGGKPVPRPRLITWTTRTAGLALASIALIYFAVRLRFLWRS